MPQPYIFRFQVLACATISGLTIETRHMVVEAYSYTPLQMVVRNDKFA